MTSAASNRAMIAPFEAMEAFNEAGRLLAEGRDIIHLSVGQPGRTAPKEVIAEVAERMKRDPLGYTDARGLIQLRERIAQHYHDRYGVEVSPKRIFITVGSSAAMLMSLIAAFDAGQKVALARPYYPAYPNMLQATNLGSVLLDTNEETAFQPRVEHLERLEERPNGLIVASPSNPAGTILDPKDLKDLAEYGEDFRIRLISDEIYHGVSYGKPTETVLKYSKQAFVVNSFSKYFLLPGWRLGWAVVPEGFCRAYESLSQSFFISAPSASQYAALAVFDHLDYLDETVRHYSENRELLLPTLRALGFRGLQFAEGAFYLYSNISELSNDSREFCRKMLHEAGVCAVPGTDFDNERGHHYVRFSYAGDHLEIAEAAARLRKWMG